MGGQFAGKTAIVTGAASGICRVIVQSFVRQGGSGVIADVNEEWGQQVVQGLRAEGGAVMFVKTDVTDTAAVERLFEETVRAYGGVDILVNCAGVGVHKTVVEMTDEEWDFQIDTQLRAVFLTCRAAARRMIAQGRGGRIINIGSCLAERIAGREFRPINYEQVPGCTYCDPEIGSVGLSEKKAQERGYEVKTGTFKFGVLARARIAGETEGFVKIVFDKKYDEILGVHMIGPRSTELVAEATLALRLECTVEELIRTIHAHPTMSEAVAEAAHAAHGGAIHA